MAQDSDLEKTEQPSQQRLDKAREEGQVARSRELTTFVLLMAGGAGLWLMGSVITQKLIKVLRDGLTLDIEGRKFHFTHGHIADPYCAGDTPGVGRITAIYSGLAEDRNGSPMLDKYRTVEDKVVGRLEWFLSFWSRLRGKPDRFTAINRRLHQLLVQPTNGYDVVVCGHTHFPGRIGDWHYNTGTWAERVNSFVRVDDDGTVSVREVSPVDGTDSWRVVGQYPDGTPDEVKNNQAVIDAYLGEPLAGRRE